MLKRATLGILLIAAACPAFGFALLGPYADWMTWSNGYRRPGQQGGPMDIGEEYRWNVPVITYGYDAEFVAYFGEEGMAAVESAISMIAELPPASEISLGDYSERTLLVNQDGRALGLFDVKTFSLQLILTQLGLAEPGREMWTIRERTGDGFNVILRNFDPDLFVATNVLNGVGLGYELVQYADGSAEAIEKPLDPLAIFPFEAATQPDWNPGRFRTGLTRDDVGGLRYLYSRDNVNLEPLPEDVTNVGGNGRPVPDIAPRPGVEKLTFERMRWNTNTGEFNPVTNVFDVAYVTNGITVTQTVQRIVSRPDIVFEARDLGGERGRFSTGEYYFFPEYVQRSDTSRWRNLSELNGLMGAGPGLIVPGARITFNKIGKYRHLGPYEIPCWGSFDQTANEPVTFAGNERLQTLTLDSYVQAEGTNLYFTSVLMGEAGAVYDIERSSNLADWTAFTTVTNDNPWLGYFSFRERADGSKMFYRAVRRPQP